MKRILALALALSCLLSCAALAAETAAPTIGGKTAQTVTLDLSAGVTADVCLAQGSVNKDQSAAELLAAAAGKGELVAAVNGGCFNADYASGTALDGYGRVARCYADVVQGGVLINGGGKSAVCLGFTEDGKALIDEVTVTLYVVCNGKRTAVPGVNDYSPEPGSVLLFTPEAGCDLPVPANAKAAKIVNGRVTELLTSGTMACAANTYYFVCGRDVPAASVPSVGNAVTFSTEFSKSTWSGVTTAVSAGPWLLRNGKSAFSENGRFPYITAQHITESAVAARSFAALLGDGSLLLGACTASPKQITEYLLSAGATDALLLDGGASSMLSAGGETLRAAGRKLNHILCFYGSAEEPLRVVPSNQALTVDGVRRETEIYNINDRNYFKLRDMAMLLSATNSRFSVTYNRPLNRIVIRTGEAYTPDGSELARPSNAEMVQKAATAVKSAQTVQIDGRIVDLAAYNIGGNNYFALVDLGEALGFDVSYNDATRTVSVKSR